MNTTLTFGSVGKVLDYIRDTKPHVVSRDYRSSERTNGLKFTGTQTWEDAEELAREGWKEGAEMIQTALAKTPKMGAKKLTTKRQTFHDVSGEEADVSRFIAGDPESMTDTRRVKAKGKTVRVIRLGVNFSYRVSAEVVSEYAIVIAAAVQKIEQGGNRVELWVEKRCSTKPCVHGMAPVGDTLTVLTKVKDASARIHPAQLAFACHPSFQRRIMFAVVEREPKIGPKIQERSYGFACNSDKLKLFLTKNSAFLENEDVKNAIAEIKKQ